jgi:hypothetical protein
VKVSEQSTVPPRAGEEALPQTLVDNIAAGEKVSLSAIVARSFAKFDVALRARLLGRLLASVGPLALKVVGGGVFAKYVRHARSPEIPVSFNDAAHATSSQVRDLVHYVEQSNPRLVEELSTTPSPNEVREYFDQAPLEIQRPSRRIVNQQALTHEAPRTLHSAPCTESEDPPPGLRFRRRGLHDY